MSYLIKPKGYKALLNLAQTEMGIKQIKDFFQQNLSSELRLRRVTAPLFVLKGMGINDDLNGVERAVSFPIKDLDDARAEIVHSLAKWKRLTLADYKIEEGYGIYTDMNAIRSDEELGNLHSLYVDQWDWERTMRKEDRTSLKKLYAVFMPPWFEQNTWYTKCFRKLSRYFPVIFSLSIRKNCFNYILPFLRKNGKTKLQSNMVPCSLLV